MKKVYIAGPLFSEGDRWYLEKIDQLVNKMGGETYLPHRDGGLCPSDGRETSDFYKSDLDALHNCDIVIAVLNGTDIDSGTAWEMGYAFGLNREILAIADDIRIAGEITNINLMLSNSSEVFFNMNDLEEKLKEVLVQ